MTIANNLANTRAGTTGAVGSTEINQETIMNKTLLALAAATSITVSLLPS
jgi:hypothetical protein